MFFSFKICLAIAMIRFVSLSNVSLVSSRRKKNRDNHPKTRVEFVWKYPEKTEFSITKQAFDQRTLDGSRKTDQCMEDNYVRETAII